VLVNDPIAGWKTKDVEQIDRIFPQGGFVQGTFDGASKSGFLDNTDIRYANNPTFAGKNLIYGLTVKNSPTLQDVWNSTPAFGFPHALSSVAPTPAAGTIIDGALDQQAGGLVLMPSGIT
jgi:hypothetical protein